MSDAKKMLNELAYTHLVPKDDEARDLVEVVRCKDCIFRGRTYCPMLWEELLTWEEDGYQEYDYAYHDNTEDEGFCHKGERKDDD